MPCPAAAGLRAAGAPRCRREAWARPGPDGAGSRGSRGAAVTGPAAVVRLRKRHVAGLRAGLRAPGCGVAARCLGTGVLSPRCGAGGVLSCCSCGVVHLQPRSWSGIRERASMPPPQAL